jgi:hypothetical protein
VSDEPVQVPGVDRIRVTLDLRRSDDPGLFEALASLPKGRRRIARLRVLAHDGLLASEVLTASAKAISPADLPNPFLEERADLAPLSAMVTQGVFDSPITQ